MPSPRYNCVVIAGVTTADVDAIDVVVAVVVVATALIAAAELSRRWHRRRRRAIRPSLVVVIPLEVAAARTPADSTVPTFSSRHVVVAVAVAAASAVVVQVERSSSYSSRPFWRFPREFEVRRVTTAITASRAPIVVVAVVGVVAVAVPASAAVAITAVADALGRFP